MTLTVPTFLVAGAARSGTTGLVEGLRTHPDVFVTQPKEPHYFALHRLGAHFTAPGDDHTINRVAVTDREEYLALYPDEHAYVALGDASVSTLYYYDEALPEVMRLNPGVKFVVLLREPVDRAFSSHQYLRARGLEPVEDFLAAVELEDHRKALGWHHLWHYTSMSRYADALEAILAAVPPEQVGVWFYDDLNRDYEGTVGRVLEFLGVTPHPGQAEGVPRVNISGKPRSAMLDRGLAWVTGAPRLRSLVKNTTSYRFRERVRRLALSSTDVPPAARAQLAPRFVEDLQRLRHLLPDPHPRWLSEPGARP